jgi:hypothetical protein
MNINKTLTAAREEWKRQMEMMKSAQAENPYGVFGCRYADELARLNPARLKVAGDKLTSAESCWGEWDDLVKHPLDPIPGDSFTEERAVDMFKFEGGWQDMEDAAALLGMEVINGQGN